MKKLFKRAFTKPSPSWWFPPPGFQKCTHVYAAANTPARASAALKVRGQSRAESYLALNVLKGAGSCSSYLMLGKGRVEPRWKPKNTGKVLPKSLKSESLRATCKSILKKRKIGIPETMDPGNRIECTLAFKLFLGTKLSVFCLGSWCFSCCCVWFF